MLPKTIYGLATSTTPGLMSAADKAKLDSNVVTTSLLGANNGIAQLDASGKVPASQLPAYVDDVLEYNSASAFPATGESDKIYIAKDTNLTYRWGGSDYVEISASLALGETSSTAYRGDYGAAAYAHGVTNKGSAFTSGLYKITTNSEGHVTAATAVVQSDITALGISDDQHTHLYAGSASAGGPATQVGVTTINSTESGVGGYLALINGVSGAQSIVAEEQFYIWNVISNNALTHVYLDIGKGNIKGGLTLRDTSTKHGDILTATLTENRYYTLPDATGTIALTSSDITGTAAKATSVVDAGNSSKTLTIRYSGSGAAATDWLPMHDSSGNLIPVSSTNLANKVRDKASGDWGISITGNAATATADADGNTISSTYLKLSGGTMTGALTIAGSDIQLGTPSTSSNDSGDLVWLYGNGSEKMRLYSSNNPTEKTGPAFRMFNASGQSLYSGNLPLADGTSASGTWNINITGSAGSVAWANTGHPDTFPPSSHTHTMSQITWPGGQNLVTSATANGQEWSIDLSPGTYTGTYWHVWSGITGKTGTILGCYPDDKHITMPGNLAATSTSTGTLRVTGGVGVTGAIYAGSFNGPLTGNVTGNISGNAGTVSHTLATTTKYYISGTTLTATGNSAVTFDTGIYSTTTAGQLNATTYLVNEKVRLEYNSTDLSLDFVFV